MTKIEKNELITKILKVIYWVKFNEYQSNNIISIIELEESSIYKANQICEFLKIPKRENRSAIAYLLEEIKI